jgi:hypothetical protein
MTTAALESKSKSTQTPAMVAPLAGSVAQNVRRNLSPRPAVHDPDATRALVTSVIERIEECLDEETAALDKFPDFDLKASNDRKSQGLVDLNQAMRRLTSTDINEDLQMRLQMFRKKLAINLRKIRLHLDAVREITAVLSDAIQNAESDGTYTRHIGPSRSEPWSG